MVKLDTILPLEIVQDIVGWVGENIFIGCKSGYYTCISTSGACRNIFMGPSSGCIAACGKNNIFFGAYTGCWTDGSCNIAIGPGVQLSFLLPITN